MPANTVPPSPRPELSPFARDLAARIRRDGPLPLATFMGLAAQEYYAGQQVFGRAGDFTTAPEISQLFGEMIALWLTTVWLGMGEPDEVMLVELGPGRGTLSADIMRTIRAWPTFAAAVRLHLVETSPRLRAEQAAALAQYTPTWHDTLDDVPAGATLLVANEFLDALPIHQFEKTANGWMERYVTFDDEHDVFVFTLRPVAAGVEMPQAFAHAPAGSIFELSPPSLGVMQAIGARLRRDGGAALLIDYGHAQTGLGDTLQALERHAFADALQNPGGRDITAHVDFMTCAAAAGEGVAVHGPVTQGAFLQRMGIVARAQALAATANPADAAELTGGLARLVDPAQMGRLFKVMALTPATQQPAPAGFDDTEDGHG